jgi:Fe-S-cluster containining protein
MPRDIITNLDMINELAERRSNANWRFRSFVKGELDVDDGELDALVQQRTDEVWKQIDCATCANCCRTLQVVIDEGDIDRLAQRLGVSAKEFTRQYVSKSEWGDQIINRQPCPFLKDNLCSVYEDRPKSCRDFPYLHSPGFRSRMMMMVQNTGICPIVFNTVEALKDNLGFLRLQREKKRR